MQFHQHALPNGLTILGETNPAALSVAVAFWVKTGSRDETPAVSGVSHFLEHMVFKGTPRRDAVTVNRDFSRIGADNNAWTSEENTVFHAVVLPEFLPEVVDVLADILRPSLRGEDFDTEKKVILDEIAKYQIQPSYSSYEHARKNFYADHPLGNSVLGTTSSITALTRDQMADYFRRRYVAPNIVAVAAGNFDWQQFVSLVEKATANWPRGDAPRTNRTETTGAGGVHVIPKPADKVAQQYVTLIAAAPAADAPLGYAGALVATVVGDYTGSRLFWALTDPGLADEAGMGIDECDSAGAFYTSFNCPPERAAECFDIVRGILEDVQKNGVSDDEFQQAKTKILSREVRAGERTQRRMSTVVKDWVYRGKYRSVDDELAVWDSVTLKDVREVLDRYPLTNQTVTAYGPLEKLGVGLMSAKTQREMLEAAIAADFDDLAAHAAYADLLAEEGDPRGEYIQLHLALENPDQSPRLRSEWAQRAHRLLQEHERDWLRELAPFLDRGPRQTVEPDTPNIEYTWKRGWLAELHVHDVRDAFTRVLADAPAARMLQVLTLENTRLPNNRGPLEPLVESPRLGTVKHFALGQSDSFGFTADGELVPTLVGQMPQLRSLDLWAGGVAASRLFRANLPELRSMTVDYLSATPLGALTENPSLVRLERLFLSERPAIPARPEGPFGDEDTADFELSFDEPVDFIANHLRPFLKSDRFVQMRDLTLRIGELADEGCELIARSGILRRLKRLDLRNCGITDAGAEVLARSSDLAHLDWLDVGGNRLTPLGVSRLQDVGIRVQWDSNWGDYPELHDGRDVVA